MVRLHSTIGCVVLLLCTSAPLASASEKAEVLTDSIFQEKMREGVWMVDFFAPWCGHCKRLAPEMDKLVGMVDGVARVGTVDATANKASADKYDVHGYPTLKLFTNQGSTVTDYKGPRDAEHIFKFIHKMLGPAVELLHTAEDLATHRATLNTSFVLQPKAAKKVSHIFQSLAEIRQGTVYFARSEVAITGEGVSDKTQVVALNQGQVRASFDSEDGVKLQDFIDTYYMPMCPELEKNTFWDFVNTDKRIVVALLDPYTDARTTEYKSWLCNSAKKSTKYRWAWMDSVKHDSFLSSMSVTPDDVPTLVVLDSPAKLHFVHRNASLTREEFITAVEAGQVVAEGEGASWWAYVKSHMLGICVVLFVAVIGFFIWLGDPNDMPQAAPAPAAAAKKTD